MGAAGLARSLPADEWEEGLGVFKPVKLFKKEKEKVRKMPTPPPLSPRTNDRGQSASNFARMRWNSADWNLTRG